MELGFISLIGLIIVIVLLIPNIIYMLKHKNDTDKYKNNFVYALEYLGKTSSIIFIIFPVQIKEFGFSNIAFAGIYMICNLILLITYNIIFASYFKKETLKKAILLSIIPTLIFLISGITLEHPLLISSSIIFGISHTYISYQNKK